MEYIAQTGCNPLAARPPAKVTACCSAIPTSKKRSGNSSLNSVSPVPFVIAAVIAIKSEFSLASSTIASPKMLE
ncbi:hypothetical protein ES703_22069 [subsurface metagenome]